MPTHPSTPPADTAAIEAAILHLLQARGPGKSICPSEAARALAPDWHSLLGPVRRVAIALAQAGRLEILRKGQPIDPADTRGVIRLRSTTQPDPS